MAFNKNQHFVPKVHLRPFSLDGENLSISLINLRQMKPIPNAPVKNQCSSDYFYGKAPSSRAPSISSRTIMERWLSSKVAIQLPMAGWHRPEALCLSPISSD